MSNRGRWPFYHSLKYIHPGTSGVLAARFRTYDAVAAALTGAAAGTRAVLYGPTDIIAEFSTDGSDNFSMEGSCDFTACDGSEFSIGLTSASNIEGMDGVAPTLSSAGLDCSLIEGVCHLNFMQLGYNVRFIQGLFTNSIPTTANGQAVAMGTADVYGGAAYDTSTVSAWYSNGWTGDPPVIAQGPLASTRYAGAITILNSIAYIAALAGTKTHLAGGSWVTGMASGFRGLDLFPSAGMPAIGPAQVYCLGLAAASFSSVLTRVGAQGGQL